VIISIVTGVLVLVLAIYLLSGQGRAAVKAAREK
jgi:hypothetical protein